VRHSRASPAEVQCHGWWAAGWGCFRRPFVVLCAQVEVVHAALADAGRNASAIKATVYPFARSLSYIKRTLLSSDWCVSTGVCCRYRSKWCTPRSPTPAATPPTWITSVLVAPSKLTHCLPLPPRDSACRRARNEHSTRASSPG